MAANWTRLEYGHHEVCASASHEHDMHAAWRMNAGGAGSYYCDHCRLVIDRGARYGAGKPYIETTPSSADGDGIFRTWLGQ